MKQQFPQENKQRRDISAWRANYVTRSRPSESDRRSGNILNANAADCLSSLQRTETVELQRCSSTQT